MITGGDLQTGRRLVFDVHGKPITQGSKTRNRWGGVRDDNADTLHPWRDNVRTAAFEAAQRASWERYDGPVRIFIGFCFDRPASHFGTGRNAGTLRPSAPPEPITMSSGDVDKLARAVFDSLTDAGIWRDDAQVVDLRTRKGWTGPPPMLSTPGARILVSTDMRPDTFLVTGTPR